MRRDALCTHPFGALAATDEPICRPEMDAGIVSAADIRSRVAPKAPIRAAT
jgi:hypothetical protein